MIDVYDEVFAGAYGLVFSSDEPEEQSQGTSLEWRNEGRLHYTHDENRLHYRNEGRLHWKAKQ